MRTMLLVSALAALWLAPCSCAVAKEAPAPRLMWTAELNADGSGQYFTGAEINGKKVQVVVDTGATFVSLSFEDAAATELWSEDLSFDVPLSTANGKVMAARIKIETIKVGDIELYDVEGVVMPEGSLKGTLLGMSFLSKLSTFRIEDGVLFLED